jgi:transcriptional regulator with XRE-family HTH domain
VPVIQKRIFDVDSNFAKKSLPGQPQLIASNIRLREIRKRKKLTMKELSQRVRVSESLISQIETDKVSPAIDTLLRITDELNIDFEYLFQKYKRNTKINIIKKKDRKKIIDGPVNYELLSKIDNIDEKNIIEAYYLEIKPQKNKKNSEFGHQGNELGIITEGKGEIQIAGNTYKLIAGDSISFSANEPHTLINTETIPLKAYWIITPPKEFC